MSIEPDTSRRTTTDLLESALRRDLARARWILTGPYDRERKQAVARHLAGTLDQLDHTGSLDQDESHSAQVLTRLRAAAASVSDRGEPADTLLAQVGAALSASRLIGTSDLPLPLVPSEAFAGLVPWLVDGLEQPTRRRVLGQVRVAYVPVVVRAAVCHLRSRQVCWGGTPAGRIPHLQPGDEPEPRRLRLDILTRGERSAVVAATPDQVYAVLADPTRVGEWSHEAHRARWLGHPAAPIVGARFVGSNRVGRLRWDMPCTIIAAEPGRRFAYHTRDGRPGTEWDYTLVPSGEGTRVLQRWRI